jgi:iron complex transport system substrate-binding protein
LIRRRELLMLAATAALAAACARQEPDADQTGGPVTVNHAFGETTVPAPPQRVASLGLTEQDSLLALGVVPIATTEWFGGEPFAVWPWARAALGPAQPRVLSLDNGIRAGEIAALQPDLIVATNAGVDADTYAALSAIAPTIPQSGRDAFFEPWKTQALTIATAVFQRPDMESIIQAVDDAVAAAAQAHPQFRDKTVALLAGRPWGGVIDVTAEGWRTDVLTGLGLTVAELDPVPLDRLGTQLSDIDVLLWTTENDAEQAALSANPDIARLGRRNVFTTKELAGAIAFSSPLSLPLVVDQLPPLLARALGG